MKKTLLVSFILLICFACIALYYIFLRTAPVSGNVTMQPGDYAPGEIVNISAELEMPAGYRVEDIELSLPEGWITSGKNVQDSALQWNADQKYTVAINAVPTRPDSGGEAVLSVQIKNIYGDQLPLWQGAVTLPPARKVENTTGTPLPLQLAENIQPVPETSFVPQLILYSLIAAVVIIIIFLLIRQKSRRKEKTFWQKALEELENIRKAAATGKELDMLLGQLTDTVRVYLERRFHIPATRQTAQEFFTMLNEKNDLLPQNDKDALRTFISRAELVKFACAHAGKDMLEKAASDAENMVKNSVPVDDRKGGKKNV